MADPKEAKAAITLTDPFCFKQNAFKTLEQKLFRKPVEDKFQPANPGKSEVKSSGNHDSQKWTDSRIFV